MAGYTAIADGETGLSVRTKINTQTGELFDENAKAFITAANAAAILAIPAEYLATGKIVRQLDTGAEYEWDGDSWIAKTGPIDATTIDATGAVTVGGTLGVTGDTTVDALEAGDVAVTGTLGVTGVLTADHISAVHLTASDAVDVTNNLGVGGDAIVTGAIEGGTVAAVGVCQGATGIFGGAVNYSDFEADGTLHFNGDATVWKDLIMPAANLRPGASSPSFSAFSGGVYAFRFDDAATHELHGAVELQHDYKEGTDLVFHAHWSPSTTNAGNCRWGLEYTIVNPAGTFPATATQYAAVAAGGTVNAHQLSNVYTITGTGLTIGAVLVFRIFRDGTNGADTFTGNAFLHSIGVHYECDTVGSRLITAKDNPPS